MVELLYAYGLNEVQCSEAGSFLSSAHGFVSLGQLACLDMSSCGLTEVPAALCSLSALVDLNASNNKLSALPSAIGQLTTLQNLQADGNVAGIDSR